MCFHCLKYRCQSRLELCISIGLTPQAQGRLRLEQKSCIVVRNFQQRNNQGILEDLCRSLPLRASTSFHSCCNCSGARRKDKRECRALPECPPICSVAMALAVIESGSIRHASDALTLKAEDSIGLWKVEDGGRCSLSPGKGRLSAGNQTCPHRGMARGV